MEATLRLWDVLRVHCLMTIRPREEVASVSQLAASSSQVPGKTQMNWVARVLPVLSSRLSHDVIEGGLREFAGRARLVTQPSKCRDLDGRDARVPALGLRTSGRGTQQSETMDISPLRRSDTRTDRKMVA